MAPVTRRPRPEEGDVATTTPYRTGYTDNVYSGLLITDHGGCIDYGSAEGRDERQIGCGGYGVVWAVRDPRSGKRVALKKMANVFCDLGHSKLAYRELRIMCALKHENILTYSDILKPAFPFADVFVVSELMETDLQRIIVSSQLLTSDHIKIFMYQILRGMKYLHSANILHRDLKPGNLLVNSNCFLKICDFGLARVWKDDQEGLSLTPEVVTEYYRSPELLMGASQYSAAADQWSVGCVFAELLSRRVMFQANGPLQQLQMIINVVGSPALYDMKYACESARHWVLRWPYHPMNIARLYSLSPYASRDAVSLMVRLLKFNPDERASAEEAIGHEYLREARSLYHSCMCSCCGIPQLDQWGAFQEATDKLEPVHPRPLDMTWEKELEHLSAREMRRRMYDFIVEKLPTSGHQLVLNTNATYYDQFIEATVLDQPDTTQNVPQDGAYFKSWN